jgi:cation:H+ antiporter
LEYLSLLFGLAGLWFGTELTIRGAVTVASRLGVSEFIVGVAILSIGSDLPELAIAIDGAIVNLGSGDASDVVVGTAIGSSLGQIGFVLGVASLFSYLTLPRSVVFQHGSVLVGSALLLGVFGFDGAVSRTEGLALLVVYAIYFSALFGERRRSAESEGEGLKTARAWLYLLVGLAIVVVCAELTVGGAIAVAAALDVSEAFVAVIIIGLGSSLPELSISVGAAIRGRARMSVGNLVGSNIFDTLVPVGAAAFISTLRFDGSLLRYDLPFLLLLTLVVLVFFMRKRGIQKGEAVIVLALYGGYLLLKVSRVF